MRVRAFLFLVAVPVVGAVFCGKGLAQSSGAVANKDSVGAVGGEESPLKVSSGVMMGLSEHREFAKYPAIRCDEHVGGADVMRATINPEGKVVGLQWISGPEVFRDATMDAVKRWTYGPYMLNGRPVWVETTIALNVDFACGDSNAPPGSEKNPLKVPSGVIAGDAIRQERPNYPQIHCGDALRPESGVSVMSVTINPEGTVDHLEWMRGSAAYREPVMELVRHWIYKPYLLNGKAVWVQTVVTISVHMGCVP
jgi:hypothetical protein